MHSLTRLNHASGITVNQLQSCSGQAEVLPVGALVPAMLCVLGTVTVPSAASVYNEFALKRHMDTSVHLQNFFLYFYGLCFNALGVMCICFYKQQSISTFFAGQSAVTLMLVVNNAAQVGDLGSRNMRVSGVLSHHAVRKGMSCLHHRKHIV